MGVLAGEHLQPRDICEVVNKQWPQNRIKAVATCLGECQGYIGSYNFNYNEAGDTILSEDCGLMQINIGAGMVGSALETRLLTDVDFNVMKGRELYDTPMMRNGKMDKRRFQPWVAYTTGIAPFPEFWVWHQTKGEPTGPWMPTGRYIQRAIAGVANWHQIIHGDMSAEGALDFALHEAEIFGVKVNPTLVTQKGTGLRLVTFVAPPRPTKPPADGIGPRPVPNEGF